MRRLVFLFIGLFLFSACAKSDREQMDGTWTIKEIRFGRELLYSSDKAIARAIIDQQLDREGYYSWSGDAEKGKADKREILQNEMALHGKMRLEFGPDRTYTLTAYSMGGKEIVTTGKTITDEPKKQLILESDEKTEHFTYEVSETELRLDGKVGGKRDGVLIFERKK